MVHFILQGFDLCEYYSHLCVCWQVFDGMLLKWAWLLVGVVIRVGVVVEILRKGGCSIDTKKTGQIRISPHSQHVYIVIISLNVTPQSHVNIIITFWSKPHHEPSPLSTTTCTKTFCVKKIFFFLIPQLYLINLLKMTGVKPVPM